jgi:hypothetical protein
MKILTVRIIRNLAVAGMLSFLALLVLCAILPIADSPHGETDFWRGVFAAFDGIMFIGCGLVALRFTLTLKKKGNKAPDATSQ